MAACSQHPQAAWRFMRFVTSPAAENLLYVKLRRCFPTRVAVAESKAYLESVAPPFHMHAFLDAVRTGRPLPIDDRWPEWTNSMQAHLDQIWAGRGLGVAAELANAARDANRILAQEPGW